MPHPLDPDFDYAAFFRDPPAPRTPRLTLRPPRLADAPPLFDLVRDPRLTRFTVIDSPAAPAETEQWLRDALAAMDRGESCVWIIELNEADAPIGAVGLRNLNPRHARIDTGFWLGRPHWGRGLMPEALRAMLAALFAATPINRVVAHCNIHNRASARTLEKVGFRHEGIARQGCFLKNQWWDLDLYALLRDDWSDAP